MSYGLQIQDASGAITLRATDKTIRFAGIVSVTVPTTGTTNVNITSDATTTNSIVVLDNGANVEVTSTGVATISSGRFIDSNDYITKLRVFLVDA